jgi:outer membrane protein, multidrug efflux system
MSAAVWAGAALCVAALSFSGCTMMGPNYERPKVELPDRFQEPASGAQSAAAATTELSAQWWRLYGDPQLDQLVDQVLAGNNDLKLAFARLEEAQAVLREADAALLPEIDASGYGGRQRLSNGSATVLPPSIPLVRNEFRAVLSTSFEIDFWGRLRRAQEAARAQLLGSRFAHDVAAISLAATTVQTYVSLRATDAQVALASRTLTNREETLALARGRARAGQVSDLDVHQAEQALADTSAQRVELQRQRDLLEHALAALAAQPGLKIAEQGDLAKLPLPPVPAAGLPSALLDRRPDIRAAEQTLASANALIGVARASMFPTISLTAFGGGLSQDLAHLLSVPAQTWNLSPSFVFPIFDSGRLEARTEEARARQRQALAGYQQSIQTAFREVADALSSVQRAALAEQALGERATAAGKALRLAHLRYKAGYAGYLDVLDAQRTQFDADAALLRGRQARLAYSVDLMKSLGGGWTEAGSLSLKGERSPSSSR